jgi:rubrerythrin
MTTGEVRTEREARRRDEAKEVRVDRDEIVALLAIARLDMEAAAACEVAAEIVDIEELRRTLLSFRDDHERHVEDIVTFARSRGTNVMVTGLDRECSPFAALASSMGTLDPDAAIEALLGDERLTNATYETALRLIPDEVALKIVKRNAQDVVRHLAMLERWVAEHVS